MATEIAASFTLRGSNVDPGDITAALGIVPSTTWRVGDLIPNTPMARKDNGWRLSSPRRASYHLEDEIKYVIDKVSSRVDAIRATIVKFRLEAEIACAVYVKGDVPSMHLDNDLVRIVAELGADIDIDLYVLPP